MDKYPVQSFTIEKEKTNYKSVDAIIEHFKSLVDAHPVCLFIAIFDHYRHTNSLEGHTIAAEIQDAKNLIFCFGKELKDPRILAARPRSIGVSDMGEYFSIDFMDAPNAQLNATMIEWVDSLTS